jgi:hypothetical protein
LKCAVDFPPQWIDANKLELALRNCGGPHGTGIFDVSFRFPTNCKTMVDAAIRLLSLTNQLVSTTRHVQLDFEEGEAGTVGYLNRMGFFDHLDSQVEVLPDRPIYSAALHRGSNSTLVTP